MMSSPQSASEAAPLRTKSAREYLTAALAAAQSLAPLPRVCAQIAELTQHHQPSTGELTRLIETDAALAGEVMRVANSAAMRPRVPIAALRQAISWLGVTDVRNIATAVMLRGIVFVAPGYETLAEALWRESWLAALWAKEIARACRKSTESAYLAGLMHRSGAALTLQLLARFESSQPMGLPEPQVAALIDAFEPAFGRGLMNSWNLSEAIQAGASEWRHHAQSAHADLAALVNAAHLLALSTMAAPGDGQENPCEEILDEPVFARLGLSMELRHTLLEKRARVLAVAGTP